MWRTEICWPCFTSHHPTYQKMWAERIPALMTQSDTEDVTAQSNCSTGQCRAVVDGSALICCAVLQLKSAYNLNRHIWCPISGTVEEVSISGCEIRVLMGHGGKKNPNCGWNSDLWNWHIDSCVVFAEAHYRIRFTDYHPERTSHWSKLENQPYKNRLIQKCVAYKPSESLPLSHSHLPLQRQNSVRLDLCLHDHIWLPTNYIWARAILQLDSTLTLQDALLTKT